MFCIKPNVPVSTVKDSSAKYLSEKYVILCACCVTSAEVLYLFVLVWVQLLKK